MDNLVQIQIIQTGKKERRLDDAQTKSWSTSNLVPPL